MKQYVFVYGFAAFVVLVLSLLYLRRIFDKKFTETFENGCDSNYLNPLPLSCLEKPLHAMYMKQGGSTGNPAAVSPPSAAIGCGVNAADECGMCKDPSNVCAKTGGPRSYNTCVPQSIIGTMSPFGATWEKCP